MSNKILQLAAMAAMGMGSMASAEKRVSDLSEWQAPSFRLLPNPGARRRKGYRTHDDDRAFAKKVEKRRKKNKNKKTHRK